MLHHACEPTHPEPTSQDTLHTSDPKVFMSHIRVLNFAGADYTSHACQPWTNVPKIRHKTSDPEIFISHIPVLNFAGATRNRLHHACVPTHPEPTFQKYTTKLQTLRFSSHTSLFWTLPEQLAMLHHACEPTHPVPTSQDTPQTTNNSILQTHPHPTSQDIPLKISMFTLQAAKMSSLARRHGRMKTCVRPSGQKWFSVSFSGLNYLRPTYCKNALKRCSLGWNPLASWFIENQNSKICKKDQKIKS